MKKLFAMLLAGLVTVGMSGCGGSSAPETPEPAATPAPVAEAPATDAAPAEAETPAAESTSVTMWTYPVGSFKDEAVVNGFVEAFNQVHPEIQVSVEYLDYTNGDDQVNTALEAGTAPDIILEGPERLVSNWGAKGKMVDLADLWDAEALSDISATSEAVVNACKSPDGAYYEYPLCMTTHCMAINYEVFEQADALQYLDLESRTWTVDGFQKAMKAVADSGLVQATGVVYCGGQGGDQGTRALVTNLYGASYTNPEHTAYTIDSENGIKGLELLVDMTKDGTMSYDAGIAAADELQLFANGTIAMSFCWNASNESQYASQVSFTPFPMAFPSDDGIPELCGGIWGFGVFDKGDAAKIAAAKTFIEFLCDDAVQGPVSVASTGFFPVRSSYGNVYAGTPDEERMEVFSTFMPYLGDYYNVTGGWAAQRTGWWNMLQQIFGGADVAEAAKAFVNEANAGIEA